jgi:pimeloyl-ACP methyl ester carboxylesterase
LPYPQYDLLTRVKAPSGETVEVTARYWIASARPVASPEPTFPADASIFLFVHGDGSRCEEADPLIKPLLAAGEQRGHSYAIITVDLPSHGCTSMIDPLGPAFANTPPWDNHAPSPPHRPPSYPVLEFLESFVLAFMAELDAQFHIGPRVIGPMGGSLGGNMTLRLARANAPWIRHAMAWSPACVWNSLADDLVKQAGPNHCSTEGHRPEEADTRTIFFHDVFDASTNIGPIQLVSPQGDYWYRNDWQPCKTRMLANARRERRELYNRIYRQFHYRMDWEQLIYSFQDQDSGSNHHRYETFRAHLLLAAGSEDNSSPATQIYSSAQAMADKMKSSSVSGRMLFVLHTGHSMHDERPQLMANAIDEFLTTFTIGSIDHTTFEHVCDEDIHVAGKIDGDSTVRLVSRRGSILIDGKIDGGSRVQLSADRDVIIGTVGDPGDKKIDGGSNVIVTAGGSVRLGNKIDNGSTSVEFHSGTGIDIGDKIDGGALVKLRTNTGKIHVHGKIDHDSTKVIYWPNGSLEVDGGIHGGAHVSAEPSA